MKELIFNLVNGVRSGIPMCCNLFFSHYVFTRDTDCPVAATVHEKRTGKVFDVCADKIDGESDYVQCNRCYAKNRVKQIRYNDVILRWLID